MVKEAMLYEKLKQGQAGCHICFRRCLIQEGGFGFCKARQNRQGVLYSLVYSQVAAAAVDPIEKKPLYHFFPGSLAYSLATAGCNLSCNFCQNWQISQAEEFNSGTISSQILLPADVIKEALSQDCQSIAYTYTEPAVFYEYAYDIACLAKKSGIHNIFVTNGCLTKEALTKITPFLSAVNVDLKSFSDQFYRKNCFGRLQPVLEFIQQAKAAKIWVEVTTLLIPGENDSNRELAKIAEFIAAIDPEMPWHINRFQPAYRRQAIPATSLQSLKQAYKIGKQAGLAYIYLGNSRQNQATECPNCRKQVIERDYCRPVKVKIKKGKCVFCQTPIKGFFN